MRFTTTDPTAHIRLEESCAFTSEVHFHFVTLHRSGSFNMRFVLIFGTHTGATGAVDPRDVLMRCQLSEHPASTSPRRKFVMCVREERFVRCRRKRRRLGRHRDIHRVKEHLGLELVLCFMLDGWNCIPATFPTWLGTYFLFCPVYSSSQPHVVAVAFNVRYSSNIHVSETALLQPRERER